MPTTHEADITMSTRVLSTDEGRASLEHLRSVLTGGLTEQLAQLEREGRRLSDPSIWDGREASRFRDDLWPTTTKALHQAVEALTALREYVAKVNHAILAAGGNG